MADRNRRYSVAAVTLPVLLLVMAGMARASTIFVNTLEGGSDAVLCTLPDAIESANIATPVGGCVLLPSVGADQIVIGLTGTIFVDAAKLPLNITDEALEIGTFGDGPVVIDGGLNGNPQGGILNVEAGSKFLKLTALTFAHGLAEEGGAIFVNSGGNVDIRNCLFEDNTVEVTPALCVIPLAGGEGGAIFLNLGSMEITNTTFFENDALQYNGTFGGAIYVANQAECATVPGTVCNGGVPSLVTRLKLTNDTFEHNYAKTGSAIYNQGTALVKGTIFADQLDKAGTGVISPKGNCAGTNTPPVTDENYNISVDNSCGFTAAASLNNVTAAELDLDPAGLANNGGPSETVALKADSDAIDRIPVANCTDQDEDNNPLGTDQRYFGRPDPGNLNTCDSGAYEFGALGAYTLNNERVQIARSPNPNSDKVNIGLTFTSNGDPDCDLGIGGDEDALNFGVGIGLFQGTCATLPFDGLLLSLSPFVVTNVGGAHYGTLFQKQPSNALQQPNETVSARIVALTPPMGLCGEWTLNIEVAGLNTLDTSTVNLPGGNPFALLIFDSSDAESCFDVTNAIVGNQIVPPKRSTRRGVRR